ncbi:prolyl oligopeptidase family serine peptidase [Saxibacter everestensis]|uniref:prolyl oligopeptidase n=1 Tax=Saxibacter everestensis TaxID=2909229 RepID=A0ABY8QNA8_9MICO|nr:prolyl oligopeptidase family serine peptidase [Brevibacteriaceae bacterium ZFBP1038]
MTSSSSSAYPLAAATSYPPARRDETVDMLHGTAVEDPYRWLEAAESSDALDWLRSQAQLFGQARQDYSYLAGFRARVAQLFGAGAVGSPVWRGDRCFFTRRAGDQNHAVLLVSEPGDLASGSARIERVLVDPNSLDPDGLATLDAWQPSQEGDRLTYQVSVGGTEESVLHTIEVASGDQLDEPIDRARYSPVAWLPGGDAFFYVRRLDPDLLPEDEKQYHRRVWLHQVGDNSENDELIFGNDPEADPHNYYGVAVSRDGRWLTVVAASGTAPRTDVWIAALPGERCAPGSKSDSADAATADRLVFREVIVGADAKTAIHIGRDGRMYVFTDLNAPRGRIAVADPRSPDPSSWKDLVAEDPEAVLEEFSILDGPELDVPLLVVATSRHAISQVSVHELADGTELGQIELPGTGSVGGLTAKREGGHELWFGYTDFTSRTRIYRWDAVDGTTSLWASAPGDSSKAEPGDSSEAEPGDSDAARAAIRTVQRTYRSKDGTEVRLFVIASAEAFDAAGRPRHTAPTILYGYGGFGISMTPGFSPTALAWVERGGVYAIASLRGGGEEGEAWRRAGMLGNKQNVFDDFHAAAEFLIDSGFTTPEQLGIFGGSNGGLLVGAALTQRPELYSAVTCSAPLLDMLRYQHYGLGATWMSEYGDPEVAEEFDWLLAYSPCHNVHAGSRYPAVLFTVFEGDTRVDPFHARKLTALLQHATASDSPILLRSEAKVGHGARSVEKTVALTADQLGFFARQLGLT